MFTNYNSDSTSRGFKKKIQKYKQKMRTLLTLTSLLAALTPMSNGLRMTQDVYEAYGERGGTAELVCKADEFPDACKFTRQVWLEKIQPVLPSVPGIVTFKD